MTCPRSHSKQVAEPEFVPKTIRVQSYYSKLLVRVLCRLLPPPPWVVLTLSRACESPLLYKHLLRLSPGVERLSAPRLPRSRPPVGKVCRVLPSLHILEGCVSVAGAPNLIWHQIRMALCLSDIPQVLRSPKTGPVALNLGLGTEVLHPESELLLPLRGTRILLLPLQSWKRHRKFEGSLCSL